MVYQPECGISLMLLIKFGFSFMTLSEEMRKESDGFDAVSASTDLDSSSSSLVSDVFYLQWNQNIFEYRIALTRVTIQKIKSLGVVTIRVLCSKRGCH